MARIGKIELDDDQVRPTIPSPEIYHYRNKAVFHPFSRAGELSLGYHKRKGNLINIESCLLLEEPINNRLPEIKAKLARHNPVSPVTIRVDGSGKSFYVCPGLRSVEPLYHKVRGLKLGYAADGFFQVNYHILPQLIENVVDACEVRGSDVVVDAYCGVGLLGLFLAKRAKQVIGIEQNRRAIVNARANARDNNCQNIKFIRGEVADILTDLGNKFDVALLDPPRTGCSKKLIRELVKRQHRRLVYLSCDPVTLARDLAVLCENAYNVEWIQPLDLFPQTFHIENIAVLTTGF